LPLAGLDHSARRVFGKRTAELWREWQAAAAATAAADADPAAPPEPASQPAWWVGTPVPHGGRVYFLRSLPYPAGPFRQSWRHELRELGPEGERTLARFPSSFSADLKWREGRLYFALRELERGLDNVELLGFGAGSVLYALDPAGGRAQRVMRAPLRAYEVLPGGDVLYSRDRRDGFGSEILLWKRRPAAGEENPRLLAASDYLVREILVREGSAFVSARRQGENFAAYAVEPASYDLTPLLPGPEGAGGLDFAGGLLRFAANSGGQLAVYAWQAGGPVRLTPEPYAAFPALDPSSGQLWYVGVNPQGYALYRLPPGASAPEQAPEPTLDTRPQPDPGKPAAAQPARPIEAAAAENPFRSGGYGPNLLTLAPRILVPVLAADTASGSYLAGASVFGRTALGDIGWSATGLVNLSTGAPAAEGSLELLTPPLAWNLAASTRSGGWLGAAVELPVFHRLTPFARGLSLGLTGWLYGQGLPGRALQPFLGFGLGWPLDTLEARLSLWLEREEWGAAESLARLRSEAAYEHSFRFGALRAALEGLAGLDGGEGELEPLRGSASGLAGTYGAAVNLDFFVRLLQIRAGTWNPPFFVQDVYLVPFAGAAWTDGGRSQVSAGAELSWELKTLAVWTGLPLELTVGLAVNGEAEASLFIELDSPLEGLPLAGAKPGRMR
jgi:hypothetical protein